MPLSKKRDAERKKIERAKRKKGQTVLLFKAQVREMHRLGVEPSRYLRRVPVSLDDYRDLERRLQAKAARVQWQSGGIKMLHDQIATLTARLATFPAMQESEVKQRVTRLEAEQALRDAVEEVREPTQS